MSFQRTLGHHGQVSQARCKLLASPKILADQHKLSSCERLSTSSSARSPSLHDFPGERCLSGASSLRVAASIGEQPIRTQDRGG